MPELEFYPEAREDLKGLDEAVQQAIFERLDRLERERLSIPEVDYWEDTGVEGFSGSKSSRIQVKRLTTGFSWISKKGRRLSTESSTGMWRMKNRSRKKSVKESGSESLGPGKRYV